MLMTVVTMGAMGAMSLPVFAMVCHGKKSDMADVGLRSDGT